MNYNDPRLTGAAIQSAQGFVGGVATSIPNAAPVDRPLSAVQRRLLDIHSRIEHAVQHAGTALTSVIGHRPEPAQGKPDMAVAPPPAAAMLTLDRIEGALSRLEATLSELI